MKNLTKSAVFTDIHFGRKSNSRLHNEDCLNFVKWFCERVKEEGDTDHIVFLGDWFESRSAIDVETLTYSYQAAKLINDLGLPVYFILGNHDLYYKHTRELYSVVSFHEFSNFTIIIDPLYEKSIGDGVLFCPYLFHEEYEKVTKYLNVPIWWGHLEFKGFVITGYNIKMLGGPDHRRFEGPKHIITGHFHKRQIQDNIMYMGSAFPMDFSDTGDNARGMLIYDYASNKLKFTDWTDCPKYQKVGLSNIMNTTVKIIPGARVKCLVDTVEVSYDDQIQLRKALMKDFNLRELTFEEIDVEDALTNTATDEYTTVLGINEQVITMLKDINVEQIDNEVLTKIYVSL